MHRQAQAHQRQEIIGQPERIDLPNDRAMSIFEDDILHHRGAEERALAGLPTSRVPWQAV